MDGNDSSQPRRGLLLAGAIALVVIVGATSFVVWDRSFRRAGPSSPGVDCPQTIAAKHRVPLAAIGVHRVALIGDSIMVQASCALGESLADIGVETTRHAVSGSGLLNGIVDWNTEIGKILRADKPNVVVAIFVGNYLGPPAANASGATIQPDSPEFFTAWQQRAIALSMQVRKAGARMYWVSPPPIAFGFLAHAPRLFAGYRQIKGDHFLNSGQVLGNAKGEEVGKMKTCGREREVRVSDSVHLSDDGGRIYGQEIAHDLSADLGLLVAPRPC
ncbi:MAG TPA: hypothetical protein VL856_19835 [Acidimicrobiia bacterium]|nr:hypothetical protein [Acidimicrobiia bacterium]